MKPLLAIAAALVALQTAACSSVLGFDELAPKPQPKVTDDAATPSATGDTTSSTDPGGGVVDPSAAPSSLSVQRLAAGLCAYYAKCHVDELTGLGTGNDCLASVELESALLLHAGGAGVPDAQLDACLAKLGTTCGDDFDSVAECHFKGTRGAGEGCSFGTQCASGICSGGSYSGTCGTCATVATLAARCDRATPCDFGLACVDGACRPRGAIAAKCAFNEDCAAELRCIDNACAPPRGLGQECANRMCDSAQHLECVGGHCAAYALHEIGQSCSDAPADNHCAHGACREGKCVAAGALGDVVADGRCAFPLIAAADGTCMEGYPTACR